MNKWKIKISFLILVIFMGCASRSVVVSRNATRDANPLISVAWSNDRHLVYLLEKTLAGKSQYELHKVELAHGSSEIISDDILTNFLSKPYSPIAYDHKKKLVFLPDGPNIFAFNIQKAELEAFTLNLPIKKDIEKMFANEFGALVFALPSQYERQYLGRDFWWLVVLDTDNGEIIYTTDNAWGGFFLDVNEPIVHTIELDTISGKPDTSLIEIDVKNRVISNSDLTINQILENYRNEAYSPNMRFLANYIDNVFIIQDSDKQRR